MPQQPLTFGSLFCGIGGLDLGFERAGLKCKWQVEIDDFAQKVLSKHWPNIPKFRDVQNVGRHNLESVDCIAGGFPCQDISQAKQQNAEGINGSRSGLWSEFHRIIRELRPGIVVVENVSALTFRGLDRVLGDLAESGFDAEWNCLQAKHVDGGMHRRKRIFIVAYASGERHVHRGLENKHGRKEGNIFTQDSIAGFQTRCRNGFTPDVFRMADAVSDRLDRIRTVGNAIDVGVSEYVGSRIIEIFG